MNKTIKLEAQQERAGAVWKKSAFFLFSQLLILLCLKAETSYGISYALFGDYLPVYSNTIHYTVFYMLIVISAFINKYHAMSHTIPLSKSDKKDTDRYYIHRIYIILAFVIGFFFSKRHTVATWQYLLMYVVLGYFSYEEYKRADEDVVHKGYVLLVIGLSLFSLVVGNSLMYGVGEQLYKTSIRELRLAENPSFYLNYLPFITSLIAVLSINDYISGDSKKKTEEVIHRLAQEQIESFKSLLPERVEALLSSWNLSYRKEVAPSVETPPTIRLSLDEQYHYLNGLQEEVNSDFHDHFNYSLDLIKDNKGNVFYSQVKDWASKTANYQEMGVSGNDLLNFIQEDGFDLKGWFKTYQDYTAELRDYYYQRIVNEEILHAERGVQLGVEGEETLMRALERFDDRFVVLENLRIKAETGEAKSAESDVVIVSPYGVFTVEAKNYGAEGQYGIYVARDGKWSQFQRNPNGQNFVSGDLEDVNAQSNHHVFALQELINKEIIKRKIGTFDGFIDVEGVITITNDVVEIMNQSDIPVMRVSGLYNHIRKHEKVLTDEQINQIVQILEDNRLDALQFPMTDYKKEYKQMKEFYAPIEEVAKHLHELVGYTDEVKAMEQEENSE